MQSRSTMAAAAALLLCLCAGAMAAPSGVPGRSHHRSLKQDALSNSNGCLLTIPKCEPGACATRNVFGVARWVCLRCLSNYAPVVDASGQDNIVQCVCPKGFWEDNTVVPATNCTRCAQNQYCPGGDMVENPGPNGRGTVFQCGPGLVTRTSGARSIVDCVAQAGYALSGANSAQACNPSEYAPQFNRLGKCLRCQSGLLEDPSLNLQPPSRSSKANVCKVPPGRYMSQGLVRWCPQGFYRVGYLNYTDPLAQVCVPCNQGITTTGAGMTSPLNCSVVLPGYGVNNVNLFPNGTLQSNTAPSMGANGLPNATVCNISFYSSPTGNCVACPNGTVTRTTGAKAVEECVVPPGYTVQAGTNVMPQCTNSTFRSGWVMYSDPTAKSCTSCGTNISSEPRDMDENPLAAANSLVRGTSSSCYILAGQGMIAQGNNLFVGQDCPINTYGAAGQVYGWAAAPCKPCPRNMITDGATRVNNSDVCVNDDGFGYASEGASRCAAGFYSAKGSRKPCQQCPAGRTTSSVAAQQRLITDCYVLPGFGVVNSTANSTDAFNVNTTGLPNATLSLMAVLECPVGYYGAGNSTGAKCTMCPVGSSTASPGSSSLADCNLCAPGYGQQGSTLCTPCNYGTFNQGPPSLQCTQCPGASFYTIDGLGTIINSTSTTLYTGSIQDTACVPTQSQMSLEAGQAFFAAGVALTGIWGTAPATPTTLTACLNACLAANGCMAQFNSTDNSCKLAQLTPAASTSISPFTVNYKLPPSTLTAASSVKNKVKAKMMSSGFYAISSMSVLTPWDSVGTPLGADARTFQAAGSLIWDNSTGQVTAPTTPVLVAAMRTLCKQKCDNSNVCWGFILDYSGTGAAPAGSGPRCTYRGGVDAPTCRAFYVLPTSIDLGSQLW